MTRERQTSPRPFVFTLMPFSSDFDEIYELAIKAACDDEDCYCLRVDEKQGPGPIVERIYNQINKADVVIADLTGCNKNVLYEVGYSHALGKNVILTTRDVQDIPFNLRGYLFLTYRDYKDLKVKLRAAIRECMDDPQIPLARKNKTLELYLNSKLLQEDCPIDLNVSEFQIALYNPTSYTHDRGSIQIGFVTDSTYIECENIRKTVTMPNGFFLHMFPALPDLFPQSWESFSFSLKENPRDPADEVELLEFRVFTQLGIRRYPVHLLKEGAPPNVGRQGIGAHSRL